MKLKDSRRLDGKHSHVQQRNNLTLATNTQKWAWVLLIPVVTALRRTWKMSNYVWDHFFPNRWVSLSLPVFHMFCKCNLQSFNVSAPKVFLIKKTSKPPPFVVRSHHDVCKRPCRGEIEGSNAWLLLLEGFSRRLLSLLESRDDPHDKRRLLNLFNPLSGAVTFNV